MVSLHRGRFVVVHLCSRRGEGRGRDPTPSRTLNPYFWIRPCKLNVGLLFAMPWYVIFQSSISTLCDLIRYFVVVNFPVRHFQHPAYLLRRNKRNALPLLLAPSPPRRVRNVIFNCLSCYDLMRPRCMRCLTRSSAIAETARVTIRSVIAVDRL